MKKYHVMRSPTGVSVEVTDKNGYVYNLTPSESLKIRQHSPTGFECGYGGSGPSQLALAILLDYCGQKTAELRYQDFKFKFIANMPRGGGIITEQEMADWLKKIEDKK